MHTDVFGYARLAPGESRTRPGRRPGRSNVPGARSGHIPARPPLGAGAQSLQQGSAHLVWSVPVMGLLVFVIMPFNDGCYEYWVNYDPLGDAQQHEWIYTARL